MESRKCRACNADIVMVHAKSTGNLMPLEATEILVRTDAGGAVAGFDSEGVYVKGVEVETEGPGVLKIRKSHFASCPSAGRFRKG